MQNNDKSDIIQNVLNYKNFLREVVNMFQNILIRAPARGGVQDSTFAPFDWAF